MSYGLNNLPKLRGNAPSVRFKKVNAGSINGVHPFQIKIARLDEAHPAMKVDIKSLPTARDAYIMWKAVPVNILSKVESPTTFQQPYEGWKQRVERGRRNGGVLPVSLANNVPHRIPVSIATVLTKAAIHKKAFHRQHVQRRVKNAIELIVRRGANVDGNMKLVLREDATVEEGYQLFRTGWRYICSPNLRLYNLPLPDLINNFRKAFTSLSKQIQYLEAAWAKTVKLRPSNDVVPLLALPVQKQFPHIKTWAEHRASMKENRESRKQQLREEGDAEPILSSLPKDHYSRMKQVEAMFPEMVKEVKESNRQSDPPKPNRKASEAIFAQKPKLARPFSTSCIVAEDHKRDPLRAVDVNDSADLLATIVSRLSTTSKFPKEKGNTIPANHEWFATLLKEYKVEVGPPMDEEATKGSEVDANWMDALSKKENPELDMEVKMPTRHRKSYSSPSTSLERSKNRLGRATMIKLGPGGRSKDLGTEW